MSSHHQIYQANPMKLLPLIGALLVSAAPVQASKTPEELTEPCGASEDAYIACMSTGTMYATIMTLTVLCGLRKDGIIPTSSWPDDITRPPAFKEDYEKIMWNFGVKTVLEEYPDCPIQPIS